jgi:hypothetical protein
MRLYAGLMTEVQIRISAIQGAKSKPELLSPHLTEEFCFLQLRMICELIALACLTAHGEVQGAKSGKLNKEYSADRILNRLQNLHSDFYPKPSKLNSLGPHNYHVDDIEGPFLTKADLARLYRHCGSKLHRGSLKKLLSSESLTPVDFTKIENWTDEIIALLDLHRIHLIDGKTVIMCQMKRADDGKAHVSIAEAVE